MADCRQRPCRRAAMGAVAKAAFAVLAGCASADPSPSASAFSFAVVGDAPYRDADEPRFAEMLRDIDGDPAVRFVLHAGDLKGGDEPCADGLLQRRLTQFGEVRALVYTPGDNDWTDCHRAGAGRFDPLERLQRLRRLAYADPHRSLGRQPLALESQAAVPAYREFAENAMFVSGGVVFVTLHVVGSGNGLEPWRGVEASDRAEAPRAARIDAFRRREAANLAWLQAAFDRAQSIAAPAVVVLMQANPRFELPPGHPDRRGFETVIDALARHTRRFGRPVLLAHGDHHIYVVDRPLASASPPVANLVRVQTHGHPLSGWVRVTVDPIRDDVFVVRSGPTRHLEVEVSAGSQ